MAGSAVTVMELEESDIPGASLSEPLVSHNVAYVAHLSWDKNTFLSLDGRGD